jgi:hypothetical protein
MDPKNPNIIIAGSNQNLYGISLDTGRTWVTSVLKSSFGVWGDPVLIVDTNSAFYYFHLSMTPGKTWLDRIVCQKNANPDSSFSDGSHTLPDGKQHDKQWAVVDERTNEIYLTWTVFDKYGSANPLDSTHILFSKSADAGVTWTVPIRINDRGGDCIDDDNTVEGAVPAVGPDGEVFVCWSGHEKLYFDKSTDGGASWLNQDKVIADQYGGWTYDIPGLYRCNGLPAIACDLSNGRHRGTIYINYTDQKFGENDTDVWLIKSTDGGVTWTQPKRVNDDPPGKQQFMTWMTLDRKTGFIYLVFYDRRYQPGEITDVFVAVSEDGGETFRNFKVSEKSFAPVESVFFGDYTGIAAYDGIVRPIWTRMDNGRTSVIGSLFVYDSNFVSVAEPSTIYTDAELEQNYPNPFSGITYVSFKLREFDIVTLSIYDSKGIHIANIVENKYFGIGKHVEIIDSSKLKLSSGVYYYVLRTLNGTISKKLLIIK